MVEHDVSDIAGKILKLIKPLTSEERKRVIQAALVLLGETPVVEATISDGDSSAGAGTTTGVIGKFKFPKANAWMLQNSITKGELEQVFHIAGDTAEIIGAIPGANKRKQTISAYILTGLSQLLTSGETTFTDKAARAACEAAGCLDASNHSAILSKGTGSDIAGSKDKGWTLTAPGLRKAAALVKEIASA